VKFGIETDYSHTQKFCMKYYWQEVLSKKEYCYCYKDDICCCYYKDDNQCLQLLMLQVSGCISVHLQCSHYSSWESLCNRNV